MERCITVHADRGITMTESKKDSRMQSEWMTTGEARDYLGVSKSKMWQILQDGYLKYTSSKLDKRYKMLRRAEVEEFARVNGIVPKNSSRPAA
jgi:hypothetical protein